MNDLCSAAGLHLVDRRRAAAHLLGLGDVRFGLGHQAFRFLSISRCEGCGGLGKPHFRIEQMGLVEPGLGFPGLSGKSESRKVMAFSERQFGGG